MVGIRDAGSDNLNGLSVNVTVLDVASFEERNVFLALAALSTELALEGLLVADGHRLVVIPAVVGRDALDASVVEALEAIGAVSVSVASLDAGTSGRVAIRVGGVQSTVVGSFGRTASNAASGSSSGSDAVWVFSIAFVVGAANRRSAVTSGDGSEVYEVADGSRVPRAVAVQSTKLTSGSGTGDTRYCGGVDITSGSQRRAIRRVNTEARSTIVRLGSTILTISGSWKGLGGQSVKAEGPGASVIANLSFTLNGAVGV